MALSSVFMVGNTLRLRRFRAGLAEEAHPAAPAPHTVDRIEPAGIMTATAINRRN